jgi:hypothetical protein
MSIARITNISKATRPKRLGGWVGYRKATVQKPQHVKDRTLLANIS